MRFRNLKGKEEIIDECKYIVKDPNEYKGKWNKVFQNNNPIYIEIGIGLGKFIKENALKYPDINFIGIEKQDNALARAIKNYEEDIPNLKLISMDANDIDDVFNKEIDRVYLNFSDPWPKNRHEKRRLTSEVFLEKYDKIFKGDNSIYIRTDNKDLFIYSIEKLSEYKYTLYDVTFDLHKKEENLITTEYEDKFSEKGQEIYSLKARK